MLPPQKVSLPLPGNDRLTVPRRASLTEGLPRGAQTDQRHSRQPPAGWQALRAKELGAVRSERAATSWRASCPLLPSAARAERAGSSPTGACPCQQQADQLTKTQAPAAGTMWPARWMEVMEGSAHPPGQSQPSNPTRAPLTPGMTLAASPSQNLVPPLPSGPSSTELARRLTSHEHARALRALRQLSSDRAILSAAKTLVRGDCP